MQRRSCHCQRLRPPLKQQRRRKWRRQKALLERGETAASMEADSAGRLQTLAAASQPLPEAEAPLPASALQRAGCTEDNLLTRILTRGAFVNFGQLDGGKVPGGQKAFVKSMDVPSDRPSELLLQFAPPVPLPREVVHALGSRWHAVADEALWWRGARQECWLGPGEALFGGFLAPAGGAFAYRLAPEAAGVAGCDACMFGILV
ncbi:unnamed protein product [Prorocentrum cordatum]|uniref:Altered inheritance of mitochondria protein 24, mitochondrial n=1 Tax=Prorocentrum cordatum TaxID=2364126 RepID=A0ABN9RDV2_9DINO|nr:unnamed protein product [Polarella glacialis]